MNEKLWTYQDSKYGIEIVLSNTKLF